MTGYRVGNIALAVAIAVIVVYMIYGSFIKENPLRQTNKMFGVVGKSKPTLREIVNPDEVALEQILINLGKGDFRFLKAEISVEADNKSEAKKIKDNNEALRRLILFIASKEDGNRLATPSGKDAFKKRIIEDSRSKLGLNISSIHFRNFVLAE